MENLAQNFNDKKMRKKETSKSDYVEDYYAFVLVYKCVLYRFSCWVYVCV